MKRHLIKAKSLDELNYLNKTNETGLPQIAYIEGSQTISMMPSEDIVRTITFEADEPGLVMIANTSTIKSVTVNGEDIGFEPYFETTTEYTFEEYNNFFTFNENAYTYNETHGYIINENGVISYGDCPNFNEGDEYVIICKDNLEFSETFGVAICASIEGKVGTMFISMEDLNQGVVFKMNLIDLNETTDEVKVRFSIQYGSDSEMAAMNELYGLKLFFYNKKDVTSGLNLTYIKKTNSGTERITSLCEGINKMDFTLTSNEYPSRFMPLRISDYEKLPRMVSTSDNIFKDIVSIGNYVFYEGRMMEEIVLPYSLSELPTSFLKDIKGITKVVIPSSVKVIPFEFCHDNIGLKEVVIPNGLKTINAQAFNGCYNLEKINIPDSIEYIHPSCFPESFNNIKCTKTYENLSYINTLLVSTVDNTLSIYTIKEGTKFIGKSAFINCTGLTSIVIPDSVITIGSYAFINCSGLTSIVIPDSVTSIGHAAFAYCAGLTSIVIPDSVKEIGDSTFNDCTSLSSIVIPDSVKEIGEYTFYKCSGLTSVTLGSGVTSIGYNAFSGCTNLTEIVIPDSVTQISSDAFNNCSGLTSIVIPDSVTRIGAGAFRNCKSLTSVTIGSGVTSMGDSAFNNCSGLTSIVIPDSVTRIGAGAFMDCSGLNFVMIGSGVTSIGHNAFYGCSGLVEIACKAVVAPTVSNYVFRNISSNGVLHVPQGSDYSSWLSKLPSGWTVEYHDLSEFE